MKKIFLILIALTLTIAGFSQPESKRTKVETYFEYFWTMVYCDGVYIGDLEGEVFKRAVIHGNSNLTIWTASGCVEGTGLLVDETFEIKFHGKYYGEYPDPDYRVELHLIAKGDKGTTLIGSGKFDMENGPISIKSICL